MIESVHFVDSISKVTQCAWCLMHVYCEPQIKDHTCEKGTNCLQETLHLPPFLTFEQGRPLYTKVRVRKQIVSGLNVSVIRQ